MNLSLRQIIVITALSISLYPIHLWSQNYERNGKIRGNVRDASTSNGIWGAIITDSTGRYSAKTDIDGDYFILSVLPGNYCISISSIGYNDIIIRNINVRTDISTELNVSMHSIDPCEIDSLTALQDIQNGTMIYRVAGFISYDSLLAIKEDSILAQYGLKQVYTGCTDFCSETYNRVISRYLDERYGVGWEEKYLSELDKLYEIHKKRKNDSQ